MVKSFTERLRLLRSSSISTYDFLKLFPVFDNNNLIFKLLKADVTSMYPNISDLNAWNSFYPKIFQNLSSINDKSAQHLLKRSENLNEGKSINIIMI